MYGVVAVVDLQANEIYFVLFIVSGLGAFTTGPWEGRVRFILPTTTRSQTTTTT